MNGIGVVHIENGIARGHGECAKMWSVMSVRVWRPPPISFGGTHAGASACANMQGDSRTMHGEARATRMVAVSLLLLASALVSGEAPVIRIGMLTCEANNATRPKFAAQWSIAIREHVRRINADAARNFSFDIVASDTDVLPSLGGGVRAANQLRDAGVLAVIGACTDQASEEAAYVLQDAGIPQLGFRPSSMRLSNKIDFSGFFRNNPNARDAADAIALTVHTLGWRYASILSSDDVDLGLPSSKELRLAMQRRNIAFISHYFPPGAIESPSNRGETRRALAEIQKASSRVIVLASSTEEDAAAVILTASELGMIEGYTWILSDIFSEAKHLPIEEAWRKIIDDGMRVQTLSGQFLASALRLEPAGLPLAGLTGTSDDIRRIWSTLSAQVYPNLSQEPGDYTAFAWDTVGLLASAVDRMLVSSPQQANLSGPLLKPFLEEASFVGVTGLNSFDENLGRALPAFHIHTYNLSKTLGFVQGSTVLLVPSGSESEQAGSTMLEPAELGRSLLTRIVSLSLDRLPLVVNVGFAIQRSGSQRGVASQEQELAFRASVDFFNNRQSLLRLVPIVRDTAEDCVGTAEDLVDAGAHVLIGPGRSFCAMEMGSVVRIASLPQIDYSATSAELSSKDVYPTFFRICPSDVWQAKALAKLVESYRWARVGLVSTSDPYASGFASIFIAELRLRGKVELAHHLEFETDAPAAAVEPLVRELKAKGSAVNVIIAVSTDALTVFSVASRLGMSGPGWTWIGTDDSAGLSLSEGITLDFVGMIGLQPKSGSGPLWESFRTFEGENQYQHFAVDSTLRYVAQIVDAVQAVVEAFSRQSASLRTTPSMQEARQLITNGLRSLSTVGTAFSGAIGVPVFFNEQQDGPAWYEVINFLSNGTWRYVGAYNGSSATLSFSQAVVWSDGTTNTPSDVQPSTSSKSSKKDATPFIVIGVVSMLVVLALLLIIVYLRKRLNESSRMDAHDFAAELAHLPVPHKRIPRELHRQDVNLLSRLGSGSFGEVYKATIDESDSVGIPSYLCAVKTLKENATGNDREALLREAAIMAQIEHSNVVQLIGVVTKGDPMMMVLQFCELGSLDTFLRKFGHTDRVSELNRFCFARDVADGMVYIHSLGFLHRDLAARNILAKSDMRCCVSDFGMAKDENYYSTRGGALPIRWYPPETLKDNIFGQRSDVWSFGVMLWEIWTNALIPYMECSDAVVLVTVPEGKRLQPPSNCPPAITAMLESCFRLSPAERPSFTSILAILEEVPDVKPVRKELSPGEAKAGGSGGGSGGSGSGAKRKSAPVHGAGKSTSSSSISPAQGRAAHVGASGHSSGYSAISSLEALRPFDSDSPVDLLMHNNPLYKPLKRPGTSAPAQQQQPSSTFGTSFDVSEIIPLSTFSTDDGSTRSSPAHSYVNIPGALARAPNSYMNTLLVRRPSGVTSTPETQA